MRDGGVPCSGSLCGERGPRKFLEIVKLLLPQFSHCHTRTSVGQKLWKRSRVAASILLGDTRILPPVQKQKGIGQCDYLRLIC